MKKFYDVHFHAFNLSHPNLLAFVAKMNFKLLLMTTPVSAPLMGIFGWDKKIKNLLTMMENDMCNYFLILEYYLRQSEFVKGDIISFDKNQYQKISITPLIMDFGYKNILSKTFYQLPAQKPIIEQMRDVSCGIEKYNRMELQVVSDKNGVVTCNHIDVMPETKLFEIKPFIGLNTVNYTKEQIRKILKECFIDGKNYAGVKVYPPLGFDPYPEDIKEIEKVFMLYEFCSSEQIPITTHCSDGGFAIVDKAKEFTHPNKWIQVLSYFPKLKLNLAHMGKQNSKALGVFERSEWQKLVFKIIDNYENVYADFSCSAFTDSYYRELSKLVMSQSNYVHLKEHILFGSDFMINLLWAESYNQYLETFFKTQHFSNCDKDLFCSVNPERFLSRSS
jgi:predicted TIM-barrel fold metal-dependent hydrolase